MAHLVNSVASEVPARSPVRKRPEGARIDTFDGVHCAINYDLANLSMIEVNGGYVAIDAGSSPSTSAPLAEAWESSAGGPLQALIYTHSHLDHIGGAEGLAPADTPIWGQAQFWDELDDTQLLSNAYYVRGAKQFGFVLADDEEISNGIGPAVMINAGPSPPIRPPNQLVDREQILEIGGKTFLLRSAPGETHDHLYVWMPDDRVLFAGDNLYRAFPNLYSIRGVPPRPVRRWIDSLDEMRRLQPRPELLVLGHTDPVQGADSIHRLLTDYRDAIAFVHDSVVRGINAGKNPQQLVEEIRLPPHLAEHPYLAERYGTLAGSIRGIFSGYMGWFDGNAANLEPVSDREVAGWLVSELGGRRKIAARAEQFTEQGDLRRALWLSQLLEADRPGWRLNDAIRARVLEVLAKSGHNPLIRNWQRSEAKLLRGDSRLPSKPKITGATIAWIPIDKLLRLLPSRLHPKSTAQLTMAIGFDITDTGQQYTLFIRRGVGELAQSLASDVCLTVKATEADLKQVFLAGDIKPNRREFWQRIAIDVPEQGTLSSIQRLFRLVRLSRLFIRP